MKSLKILQVFHYRTPLCPLVLSKHVYVSDNNKVQFGPSACVCVAKLCKQHNNKKSGTYCKMSVVYVKLSHINKLHARWQKTHAFHNRAMRESPPKTKHGYYGSSAC